MAALGTALLLMGLLVGVLTAWGGARANAGFSFSDALLFGLNLALISAVFAAIALFISQFTHERGVAAGLTGALFGVAILLNSLAHIAPDTEGLAHISPVYLFALSKPLIPGHGVDPVAMSALAGSAWLHRAGRHALPAARCRRTSRCLSLRPRRRAPRRRTRENCRPAIPRCVQCTPAACAWARPTLWWGLALAFFGAVFTLMARQTEQGIAGAFKGTPYEQIINTLTGGGEIGTGVWFLSIIFAELPLVFTIYALIQASNWAEDEENGRFELLLANPQARWRVLLARYAAFVTSLLVIAVALLLAVVLAGIQQNLPLDGAKAVPQSQACCRSRSSSPRLATCSPAGCAPARLQACLALCSRSRSSTSWLARSSSGQTGLCSFALRALWHAIHQGPRLDQRRRAAGRRGWRARHCYLALQPEGHRPLGASEVAGAAKNTVRSILRDNSPGYIRELLGRSQALLPQCQNVQARVQVSVEDDATKGAGIGAVGEGERLPMPTLRAVLTRVGRIHGDISPTGPCCLVREKVRELAPRCVMNALGETMGVRHPVDREVFNSDQIKGVDDAAAVLMGEIAPSTGDALMHTRHHLRRLARSGVPFSSLLKRRCDLRQRLFFSTEEARIGDLLPRR